MMTAILWYVMMFMVIGICIVAGIDMTRDMVKDFIKEVKEKRDRA